MAKIGTPSELLEMALQDLRDAEAALVERLPAIAKAVSADALQAWITESIDRSQRQDEIIERIGKDHGFDTSGDPCIWQRAICDDADNDIKSIEAGRLRDIALVGALRKAKQAQRVSYETAIVLARELVLESAAADLDSIRDGESEADAALARLLADLTKA